MHPVNCDAFTDYYCVIFRCAQNLIIGFYTAVRWRHLYLNVALCAPWTCHNSHRVRYFAVDLLPFIFVHFTSACWKIRRQTNWRSVKSRTGQVVD